jgi:hypothetical protein
LNEIVEATNWLWWLTPSAVSSARTRERRQWNLRAGRRRDVDSLSASGDCQYCGAASITT